MKLSYLFIFIFLLSSCGKKLDNEEKKTATSGASILELKHSKEEQLFTAIKEKDLLLTKQSIKDGADVNAYDDQGFRPLAYAIERENIEILDVLLENNAEIKNLDIDGNSALHLSMKYRKLSSFFYFLRKGLNSKIRNIKNETPIELAIKEDYLKGVKFLLMYDNSSNVEGISLTKLQNLALEVRAKESIQKLLQFSEKLKNAHDFLALALEAVDDSYLDGLDLLNTKIRLKELFKGQNILSRILKKDGADFSASSKNLILHLTNHLLSLEGEEGDTELPIVEAAKVHNYNGIIFISLLGAEINRVNQDGETALYIAAQNLDQNLIKLLLSFGAYREYFYRVQNKTMKVDICKAVPSYKKRWLRRNDRDLLKKIEEIKEILSCQ